jgi:hypothetical protein
MANSGYTVTKTAFGNGGINWTSDTITAWLVRGVAGAGAGGNSIYTPTIATDTFSNVPNNAYCRVASVTLATKTNVGGKLSSAAFTWPSVPAGDAIQYVLIVDTTTGNIICILDTSASGGSNTPLPVTPNGNNITFTPDGTNGIYIL